MFLIVLWLIEVLSILVGFSVACSANLLLALSRVIGLIALLQFLLVLTQLCILFTTDVNRRLDLLIIIESDLDIVNHDVDDRLKNAVPQVILLERELLELCLNALQFSITLLNELVHPNAF